MKKYIASRGATYTKKQHWILRLIHRDACFGDDRTTCVLSLIR
ncbi:hypothetical protein RSSM_01594 [Rhodopirellula sallentina SM41]|uniref:Uncharacterized protein n=1 Tax=Rhodopirellula sallentina SM41 TaxID=1263870 RepID=M5ULL5_9BACT|nr:hypothetical protein RSSM_01594 [Rhodopirellula sallentina SM41]